MALLLFATGVSGCAAKASDLRGTYLAVRCGPDGSLSSVIIDGLQADRAPGQSVDAFLSKTLGKMRSPVQVRGTADTPYRCIGGAIFSMQRAGVSKIGFIAELPSDEDSQ